MNATLAENGRCVKCTAGRFGAREIPEGRTYVGAALWYCTAAD